MFLLKQRAYTGGVNMVKYRPAVVCLAAAWFVAVAPVQAQHDYPRVDIERGEQLYRGNCIGCHGPDGNLLDEVSLTDPVYLQRMTDEQLIGIIINGVPDTAMLANNNYSESQAGNIVAYLRDLSRQGRVMPQGDFERGRRLFESGDCLDCHRVGRSGARIGPDLTRIGLLRRTDELEEALLDPDATVLPENRYVRLVTREGDEIKGRLLNHDRVVVQLLDEAGERLRLFRKADLAEFEILRTSTMPSYADVYSAEELEDLLTYLVSLGRGESR